jgi:cation:H+ antiporter
LTALFFVSGLALLIAGGELLVRGAARLAAALGVAPLVIGLTVVAFGTSSPELAVSVQAGLAGSADIAMGNVIGSNIFNVLFILGVSALIVPLAVSERLLRLDVPIMIAASAALLLMSLDGRISRAEAAVLTAGLAAYIALQLVLARRDSGHAVAGLPAADSTLRDLLLMAAGIGLLVVGAHWLVRSAIELAASLGISQLVVGLTVVAVATSMPEVVTSVIAGLRGQRDIAIGNVVGSNIFNIMAVLGVSGLVSAHGINVSPGAVAMDLPVMLAVSVLCLPILFSRFVISRWEGLLFLTYYLAYTAYLVLHATGHDAFTQYQTLAVILLPLTLVPLLIANAGDWMRRRRPR